MSRRIECSQPTAYHREAWRPTAYFAVLELSRSPYCWFSLPFSFT